MGRGGAVAVVALGMACAAPAARAQDTSAPPPANALQSASENSTGEAPADLETAYRRAFQAMIADVGNLDKTFAFAELAVKVGDYEGAIAAFERMLLIDPDLPQVKAELGALYMRIGSYRVAKSYLESALAEPRTPPAVKQRLQNLLAEATRRLRPNQISGSVTFGLRFQSNANAGPEGGQVEVGGILANLTDQFTSKRDWNAFVLGQVGDIYDFGSQDGTTLESTITFYGADQRTQKDVNLGFIELTSGPRFKLFPGLLANATIKPYVIGDLLTLGHAQDYAAPGAGLEITKVLNPRVRLEFTTELRERRFHNSSLLPQNNLQNGLQSYNRAALEERITAALTLSEALAYTYSDARLNSDRNSQVSGILGLDYRYSPPLLAAGRPWDTSLTLMRSFTGYAAPDATIDPDVTRGDHDWEIDLSTTVPLTQSLSLVTSLGIFKRQSSLPNFRFTDKYGAVGVNWRF